MPPEVAAPDAPRRLLDRRPQLRLSVLMLVVAVAGVGAWGWRFREENGDSRRSFFGIQVRNLRSGSDLERLTAAEMLASPSEGEARGSLVALVQAARDRDPRVRRAVAQAIATAIRAAAKYRHGDVAPELDAAVPPLLAGLADADAGVRAEAARSIALLRGEADGPPGGPTQKVAYGPAPGRVLPSLVKAARDADPHVRMEAIRALASVAPKGEDAPTILLEAFRNDADAAVRGEAARGLCRPWKDAATLWEPLLDVASRAPGGDGRAVLGALPGLGVPPLACLPRLIDLLAVDTPQARDGVSVALGQLGAAASPALPALGEVARTQSLSAWEPLSAVRAIASIDPSSPEAQALLPWLVQTLCAPSFTHRTEEAAEILALYGPAAVAGVDDLVAALDATELFTPFRARRAIHALGPKKTAALAPLARRVREGIARRDVPERGWHLVLLLEIDPDAPETRELIGPLLKALRNPAGSRSPYGLMSAIRALGPGALPAFRAAARDPDPRIRDAAAMLLDQIGRDEAAPVPPKAR